MIDGETLMGEGEGEITIRDKKTGVHFEHQTTKDIIDAVNSFESLNFDYKAISNEAKKYSQERFKEEFEEFVNSKLKQNDKNY